MDAGTGVDLSVFSRILDLTGAGFSALLGGLLARAERLDPIGLLTISIVSGLGGGIVRDLIIAKGTPVAFTDSAYVIAAIVGGLCALIAPMTGRWTDRLYPFLDALVLGCWAAAGADRTLAMGLEWLPAILLGTMTGVGGGAVRDILLNRTPGALRGGTMYAAAGLASSTTLVVLHGMGLTNIALAVATAVGAGVTMLARTRGWELLDIEEAAESLPGGLGREAKRQHDREEARREEEHEREEQAEQERAERRAERSQARDDERSGGRGARDSGTQQRRAAEEGERQLRNERAADDEREVGDPPVDFEDAAKQR